MDKVDFSEIYANIDIFAMQALFVMKFSPHTLKITQLTTMFIYLFIFFQISFKYGKICLHLNKGFIEPPSMESKRIKVDKNQQFEKLKQKKKSSTASFGFWYVSH